MLRILTGYRWISMKRNFKLCWLSKQKTTGHWTKIVECWGLCIVFLSSGNFWPGSFLLADSRNLLKMFVNFPRICESIMFCWILPYKFCIITKDRTWPRPFRGWWKKNLAFLDKKFGLSCKTCEAWKLNEAIKRPQVSGPR